VTVKDGGVAGTDLTCHRVSKALNVAVPHSLTRVVEDDNLGVEGSGLLGGVVLRVGADVTTTDVLDGDVLDVEAGTSQLSTIRECKIFKLGRTQRCLRAYPRGSARGASRRTSCEESATGTSVRRLQDTHTSVVTLVGAKVTTIPALMTPVSTADLVHILERKTERLVGGAGRRVDGVNGLEEGLALGGTGLGLLGPALVPGHAVRGQRPV
jgi:hypothetical protein